MSPAEAAVAIEKARVLLVDDHALLRTGVANIINQEPDLRVVAEAGNGVQAIDLVKAYLARPDLDFSVQLNNCDLICQANTGKDESEKKADRELYSQILDLLKRYKAAHQK